MKFISLLTLLFCLQAPVLHSQSSQFRFGVQIRAGISDLIFHNAQYPSFETLNRESATWRLSPGIAALSRYEVNERLWFQAGLGYELSGHRIKEFVLYKSTPEMPEPVRLGTARGTMHYHDFNLSFYTKVKPFRGARRFYLSGGLSNLVKISRRQTIIIHYDAGETIKQKESLQVSGRKFAHWNLRSDIGFGFELNAEGKVPWFIEPVFGYTLFPVISEDSSRWRQYVAGVNVGLML